MGILKKRNGFTMIEALAVVAILAILITMSIFTFMAQMAKGRDARRKADLEKFRTVLEDYMNDGSCYPPSLVCRSNFSPYLSQIPCDPLNNTSYNYFYSYDNTAACKSWYKIYTRLENTSDPIIAKVGCGESTECPLGGCGPSCNYNYWVSSPNMNEVNQIPTAEDWWSEITLPAPPPTGGPTATPAPTSTPLPGPTATPAPTSPPQGDYGYYGCFPPGVCRSILGDCSPPLKNCECPDKNYQLSDCGGQCVNPQNLCR